MTDFLCPKNPKKFSCINCDYFTSNKRDLERHFSTLKHLSLTNTDQILTKKPKKTIEKEFVCKCGKCYKHKQSLYTHKKKCDFKENDESEEKCQLIEAPIISQELIIKLVEQNTELAHDLKEAHKTINDLIPKIGNNNNNNSNNTNQKFNINVFLNEQCKDAINMSDFIKSIEVSLQQLDYTKNKGLAAGLSNTIIENMNKLGIYERPIHCTDVKRETLYVKDNDVWDKESSKDKIKYAINKTSGKNYNALQNWKKENPDYNDDDAKQDYFAHTLSTIGKPTIELGEKIIKKICVETYIKDKQ